MEFPRGLPANQRIRFVLLLLSVVGSCLLALTWDLRPFPLSATVDDGRYVLSAEYLRALPGKLIEGIRPLDWLGPYDPTTLFKRPGISLLLAVVSSVNLPFIQTVLILYLVGLAVLADSLLRLGYSRTVVTTVVFVCGLLPTLYDTNAVRVLREIATGGLELAIFGICLSLFAVESNRPGAVLRSPRFLLLLGLLALHWTIREEAVLLLPAVLILITASIWLREGSTRRKVVLTGVAFILVAIPSQLAYVGIATLNRASYGLFLVNELSEGTFPRAVSALKRVEESPCDHSLLSRDEVDKVMAVSPSFNVVGDTLKLALTRQPEMIYTDAFSVMRVAALRDKELGWSPVRTQELFEGIANEVESACSDGKLKCTNRGSRGIVPFLCGSQWKMVPSTFLAYVADHIAKARHSGFSPWSYEMPGIDRLHPETLARFETITGQKMAGRSDKGAEFSQPASMEILVRQDERRSSIGDVYIVVMPWIFGLGAIVTLARGWYWRDLQRPWSLIILFAMGVHVFCRAAVFSYLSTVDGYLNIRYISVCYPIAAALAVLAAGELRYLRPLAGMGSVPASPLFMTARKSPGLWIAVPTVFIVLSLFVYAGKRTGEIPVEASNSNVPEGRLVADGPQEFIDLNGRHVPVVADPQGWLYAEAGWLRGNHAVFDGWGLDTAASRPARAFLLFADGRLIGTATPTFAVPEVESGFPAGEHAGFVITVPYSEVATRTVRIFALHYQDRAGELFYPASYLYSGEN